MSYVIRVDGKKQSSGFGRLQPAISCAEIVVPATAYVEVIDEAGYTDRVVWVRKGASNDSQKPE